MKNYFLAFCLFFSTYSVNGADQQENPDSTYVSLLKWGRSYLPFLVNANQQKELDSKCALFVVIQLDDSSLFKEVKSQLIKSYQNDSIQGVLLVLNSSGGKFSSFSVISDLVQKIRQIKPVITIIDGCALSGGYLLASATDYIFAYSGSDIGSIGAFVEVERQRNEKLVANKSNQIEAELSHELFFAGEYKVLFHPYAPTLTNNQRAFIQEQLNKTYENFLKVVASNRGLSLENYKEWAEGKRFIAPHAKEIGLIDEIGTVFDAEKKIFELICKRNPEKKYSTYQDRYYS